MKVLVTNIGNRNITYKGKVHQDAVLNKKELPFREWTKLLLESYEQESEHLKLNILNVVLDKSEHFPNKLIIVVSDQMATNDRFAGQDTLYEGQIIEKLIREQYGINDIEVLTFKDNVTDENALLLFYQQLFSALQKSSPDCEIIICDAGGTAQQKSATKIMAEFMLTTNQYTIVYPLQDGTSVQKQQDEYRRVVNKIQAISLIEKSQYEAALNILGGNVNTIDPNNQVWNLISFTHFRYNRVLEKTKELWERKLILNRKDALIASAVFPQKRAVDAGLMCLFCHNNYLIMSETLLSAYRKLRIHNYRDSILDFAVFYETFIDRSMKLLEKEIKKTIPKPHRPDTYINAWIRQENVLPQTREYVASSGRSKGEDDYTNVPIGIHVLQEQNMIKELQPLAKLLCPYLDFSIKENDLGQPNSVRYVRNKLAHEGKYLHEKEFNQELHYYPTLLSDCMSLWGLPQEDIYEQMNEMIIDYIRNST